MKRWLHISLAGLLLVSACSKPQPLNLVEPAEGRALTSFQAVAPQAMVVTPNEAASQIGLEILKKGGNAADSAIAVSFALAVLRPQSTGLGGGGFLLFYLKEKNKTIAIDFREFAPAQASRDMYLVNGEAKGELSRDGALAVAVPRLVAGLGYIYEKYASQKISWSDLVQPSIRLAKEGFPVYPHLAKALEERKAVLKGFPIPQAGALLIQKDLAKTLEMIGKNGWKIFYQGFIANQIVSSIQKQKGIVTLKDLQNVTASEIPVVEGNYRGYKIVSMPPPSSGGTILIEILNILENFNLRGWGPYHLKSVHVTTEAMRRAFMDRARYLGDPQFVKVPVLGLISKDYAKTLANSINMEKATPSLQLSSTAKYQGNESNSTTHFSIVDSAGNAVAATETINYLFGSGLVAEGTGIVLNDEMDDFSIRPGVPNVYGLVGSLANAIEPGKIPLSSMSPTLVFDPKGNLDMVLGSPGGPKIITAVLHTLLNRIDFKATPLEAVAAKRTHHQWLPDALQVEPGGFSELLMQKLGQMGHTIEEKESPCLVMLVARDREGWVGVSDPRGVGTAIGY